MGCFFGRERVGHVDRWGVADGIEENRPWPKYREDHSELVSRWKRMDLSPATLLERGLILAAIPPPITPSGKPLEEQI